MGFVFGESGGGAADRFGQVFRQQAGQFITCHSSDHLKGFVPFYSFLGAVGPARSPSAFAFLLAVGRGFTPRRAFRPTVFRFGFDARRPIRHL
jgi:hypothetical protein